MLLYDIHTGLSVGGQQNPKNHSHNTKVYARTKHSCLSNDFKL